MSQQGTIKRYQLILELLQGSFQPSFAQIKEHLNRHGFEISPRTLQRDIQHIREEFGIEVSYNKPRNNYHINNSESSDVSGFLRFLNMVQSGTALSEQFNKSNLPYIDLGTDTNPEGLQWINDILTAAKKSVWVNFTYRKFGSKEIKEYQLQPYLLKEYEHRWYLFGRTSDKGPFKTFGLDRIVHIHLTKEKFNRDTQLDVKANFKKIIGLVFDEGKMEPVQLAVTPVQAGYLRTLPLHHSQKEIKATTKEVVFELHLIPNFELIQKILMMGDKCRVLSPLHLKKQVQKIAQEMVKLNK